MIKKSEIKMGTNRSFGLVFFIVLLIISIWPVGQGEKILILPLIISLFFLLLGLFNSKFLTPLNKLWFKFGMLLGSIISPIVMGLIFFIVMTPIGLLMKIFNKDLLKKNYNEDKESYWIKKNQTTTTMKKQF
jgi:hypothetical protein